MKILTVEQIRQADEYTVINEPVSDEALMERAAGKCSDIIMQKWDNSFEFLIICGPGNNGGDGLVIARHIASENYKVNVVCLPSNHYSDSYNLNFKRLTSQNKASIDVITDVAGFPEITDNTIIIDAIFGSGLSKPIQGVTAEIINKINSKNNFVIAIDIPSGLAGERPQEIHQATIVEADITLTFQCPKLSFFLPQNYKYTGEWLVIDIGLLRSFTGNLNSPYYYIEREDIQNIIRPRERFSHKGTFGHALLVSGSYGKCGAAVLAAKACLKSGPGLLTVRVPKCGYSILQTSVPEAMVWPDEEEFSISSFNIKQKIDATGIGPGIGTEDCTADALKFLIQNYPRPLVIDADALNILAENPTWLSFLPVNSILTPHPKEFERLAGEYDDDWHRMELQLEFSRKYNVYVVLKGAYTSISSPTGQIWFNSTGNPGMATAGCGDVLTGILTGLLAQGYSPAETCIAGVWLHGKAGDIAAENISQEAVIAGDIINYIGKAFIEIKK